MVVFVYVCLCVCVCGGRVEVKKQLTWIDELVLFLHLANPGYHTQVVRLAAITFTYGIISPQAVFIFIYFLIFIYAYVYLFVSICMWLQVPAGPIRRCQVP